MVDYPVNSMLAALESDGTLNRAQALGEASLDAVEGKASVVLAERQQVIRPPDPPAVTRPSNGLLPLIHLRRGEER